AADGVLLQPSICRERSDGLRWLARCLFPQARSKSQYHTRVSVDPGTSPVEAWDLPTLTAGTTSTLQSASGEQARVDFAKASQRKCMSTSAHQQSKHAAGRECGKTVDEALSEQGCQIQQLPAELLGEEIPLAEAWVLLPPLPSEERGRHTCTQDIGEVSDAKAECSEEMLVLRERPASFRRAPLGIAGFASSSSSRPTTAGEESAATHGSRISGKSSWRSQWTPGQAGVDDTAQSMVTSETSHQPPPPPKSERQMQIGSAGSADDPAFLLALKRASESVSAKFAEPPALGHRKWGKASRGGSEADLPASCDADPHCTIRQEEAAIPEQAAAKPGFSDLALSFASLDGAF
ncbi:unnamed protein product, partial [Symbiodinium pilosum]